MTREEARKLVNPPVWYGDKDDFYAELSGGIVLDVYPSSNEYYYVASTDRASLSTGRFYSTSDDAKIAAEEWYINFILGFLNLEGGEA